MCKDCPAGKYSEAKGASSASTCDNCAAGKYSEAKNATSASTCKDCPSGKYSVVLGAGSLSFCSDCGPGRYSSSVRASSLATCLPCDIGKYSVQFGAISSSTYVIPCEKENLVLLLPPNLSATCMPPPTRSLLCGRRDGRWVSCRRQVSAQVVIHRLVLVVSPELMRVMTALIIALCAKGKYVEESNSTSCSLYCAWALCTNRGLVSCNGTCGKGPTPLCLWLDFCKRLSRVPKGAHQPGRHVLLQPMSRRQAFANKEGSQKCELCSYTYSNSGKASLLHDAHCRKDGAC